MGLFSKKGKKDHHTSNPLLQEQALTRRAPAQTVIAKAPEAAREASWLPPLQRHIKPDDGTEFVTIRVRILNGDSEHDFNAKFPSGPLLGSRICKIIAEKEALPEAGHLFTLWIVAKDLELQIRPDVDIFAIMAQWNTMVLDYTHYPEAVDPTHPINRHWFVYRREASVTKNTEKRYSDDATVRLLYGEAKRNVMTGRYVCTLSDGVALGGMMLAISTGSYDRIRHPAGYCIKNDLWKTFITKRLQDDLRPEEWETCLQAEHAKHIGRTTETLRIMFLELVREWACYGCSFFPCCREKPPAGFFEFRLQRWLLGVSTSGVVVMDLDKNGYAFAEQWEDLVVRRGPDRIILRWKDHASGKDMKMKLFTPQAMMVQNLALRSKYVALKEAAGDSDENNRTRTTPASVASAQTGPGSTATAGGRSAAGPQNAGGASQTNANGPHNRRHTDNPQSPTRPEQGQWAAPQEQGQPGSGDANRKRSSSVPRPNDMPPVYEESLKHRPAGTNLDPSQLGWGVPPGHGGPYVQQQGRYSVQPPAPTQHQNDNRRSYQPPRVQEQWGASEPSAPPIEHIRQSESWRGEPLRPRADQQPQRYQDDGKQTDYDRQMRESEARFMRQSEPQQGLPSEPSRHLPSELRTRQQQQHPEYNPQAGPPIPTLQGGRRASQTKALSSFTRSTSFQHPAQQQQSYTRPVSFNPPPATFAEPRRISMQAFGGQARTEQEIRLQEQIAELESLQVSKPQQNKDDNDYEGEEEVIVSTWTAPGGRPSPQQHRPTIPSQPMSVSAVSSTPSYMPVGRNDSPLAAAFYAPRQDPNVSNASDGAVANNAHVVQTAFYAASSSEPPIGQVFAGSSRSNSVTGGLFAHGGSMRSRSNSTTARMFADAQQSELLAGYQRPTVVATRKPSMVKSISQAFKNQEGSSGPIRRGADQGPDWSAGSYADYN